MSFPRETATDQSSVQGKELAASPGYHNPGVVMKAALLLLVLFVRPPTVVTIHGRVTDSSRGNGIAGASIVIPELNLSAQTDTAGRYNIRSTGLAANGTVTIEARRIGYFAGKASVAV